LSDDIMELLWNGVLALIWPYTRAAW